MTAADDLATVKWKETTVRQIAGAVLFAFHVGGAEHVGQHIEVALRDAMSLRAAPEYHFTGGTLTAAVLNNQVGATRQQLCSGSAIVPTNHQVHWGVAQ